MKFQNFLKFSSLLLISTGWAIDITVTAPKIKLNTSSAPLLPSLTATLENNIQSKIDLLADSLETTVNSELSKYGTQKKLAKGFANANMFTSRAGQLSGWHNYKIFSVSGGLLVGAQGPSLDVKNFSNLDKDVRNEGDIYMGGSVGLSVNAGLNTSFLVPGLRLNASFITLPKIKYDYFSFKQTQFGLGASYQLLESKGIPFLATWKGIHVLSGLYYQASKASLTLELDTLSENTSLIDGTSDSSFNILGLNTLTLSTVPSLNLELNTATYTLPLEVSTAVQLLYVLNLGFATGIDLTFGGTEIEIISDNPTTVTGGNNVLTTSTEGQVVVDASTKKQGPSFTRLHFTFSAGLNMGPLKLEAPLTLYPSAGLSIGVRTGVVF